jgi:Asp-tRNA(Asn)/Glu-tRNA(Gln) amidotransferase C subunit
MDELSSHEIAALAKAVDLEISEVDLDQVAMSLNAILQLMDEIDIPMSNLVEPVPVVNRL